MGFKFIAVCFSQLQQDRVFREYLFEKDFQPSFESEACEMDVAGVAGRLWALKFIAACFSLLPQNKFFSREFIEKDFQPSFESDVCEMDVAEIAGRLWVFSFIVVCFSWLPQVRFLIEIYMKKIFSRRSKATSVKWMQQKQHVGYGFLVSLQSASAGCQRLDF